MSPPASLPIYFQLAYTGPAEFEQGWFVEKFDVYNYYPGRVTPFKGSIDPSWEGSQFLPIELPGSNQKRNWFKVQSNLFDYIEVVARVSRIYHDSEKQLCWFDGELRGEVRIERESFLVGRLEANSLVPNVNNIINISPVRGGFGYCMTYAQLLF